VAHHPPFFDNKSMLKSFTSMAGTDTTPLIFTLWRIRFFMCWKQGNTSGVPLDIHSSGISPDTFLFQPSVEESPKYNIEEAPTNFDGAISSDARVHTFNQVRSQAEELRSGRLRQTCWFQFDKTGRASQYLLIEPVCGRQILFSPRHGTEVRRGSGCRE
jgi:hypothetical protein